MRSPSTSACKRLRPWLPCTALALSSAIGVATLSLGPPRAGPVAALFPPWWSATRSMRAAASAGRIVRFGAAGFVVVVVPDDAASADRLHRSGAWLLLDPEALGGCIAA